MTSLITNKEQREPSSAAEDLRSSRASAKIPPSHFFTYPIAKQTDRKYEYPQVRYRLNPVYPRLRLICYRSAANYVTESVKGGSAEAQKEAHKRSFASRWCCRMKKLTTRPEVAKDPNASLSTRASATKDMISDKMDQHQHNVSGPPFESSQGHC